MRVLFGLSLVLGHVFPLPCLVVSGSKEIEGWFDDQENGEKSPYLKLNSKWIPLPWIPSISLITKLPLRLCLDTLVFISVHMDWDRLKCKLN